MHPGPEPAAAQPLPAKPPAPVRAAQVMLILGSLLLLLDAYGLYLDAGQNAEAWGRASVPGIPAVLMLALGALLAWGRQVARSLAVLAGALMLFFGLGDVGQGRLDGLLVAIFGAAVIANVLRRPAREWFRRPRTVP